MTDEQVRAEARKQIEKAGGMEAWCSQVGLSRGYVYRQVNAVDEPGAKMLRALKIEVSRVVYRRAEA